MTLFGRETMNYISLTCKINEGGKGSPCCKAEALNTQSTPDDKAECPPLHTQGLPLTPGLHQLLED